MEARAAVGGPRWMLAAMLALAAALMGLSATRVAGHPPPAGPSPAAPDRGSPAVRPAAGPTPAVGLSPGACRRFGPTGPGRGLTVFVDPGHGGLDTGAIGTTAAGSPVEEKGADLAIGLDLASILRAGGDTVVMSRVSDTLVAHLGPGDTAGRSLLTPAGLEADLRARVACANASGAQVLIGLHLNAFADPSVGGAETIYSADRPFSARSRALADLLQEDVVDALTGAGWTVASRGVVTDAGQGAAGLTSQARAYGHLLELGPARPGYFTDPTTMPGAIVEPLFVTDPAEAAIAADPAGALAVARGVAAAVQAFLAGQPGPR